MAYFTNIVNSRELTASETAERDAYVAAQVTAGTTTGQKYLWGIPGTETYLSVKMWSSIESANGFKDVYASFNPAIEVAVY